MNLPMKRSDFLKFVSLNAAALTIPVLLHAAAFETSLARVALIEPLSSYRSIVMNPYYKASFVPATVAGTLTAYDLPDLAASLTPRPLLMVNVTDQNGDRAGPAVLEQDLAIVRGAYAAGKGPGKLTIRTWEAGQPMDEIFSPWLK